MKFFKISEFDSPDLPGSGTKMQPKFLKMIDDARALAGVAFSITSGYRTEAHNKKVGGVEDSSHCQGWAADIAASSGTAKWAIVDGCIKAGFNRIGIANGFIHVDCDPTKPARVIWTY